MSGSKPPRARRAAAAPAEPGAPPPPVTATLTFKGTEARIVLPAAATVTAIEFDGRALPDGRWRATGPATLTAACPPFAFDGAAHTLHLRFEDGAPGLTLDVQSRYRWALDRLDDGIVRGWIYDVLRPASSLRLRVTGEFWPAFTVLNTITHPALAENPDAPLGGGFEILLPPRPANAQPEVLRITVQGTDFAPFGPILRGATQAAAVQAVASAVRALGRTASGLLAGSAVLPKLIETLADPAQTSARLEGASRLAGTLGQQRATPPFINVVVPVYRGLEETLACLHSVLASGGRVARRVVAIDDCSPEPELSDALRALATDGAITYLRNERNLGFVGTANRGLSELGGGDVLLLNSDTVVPPGFLDRLYRAAYSDRAIATVTPLSNNATICSLPQPPGTDGDPYGLDALAIDVLCQQENAGAVQDIPTAHGFCMYIKRAAIDDVGLFDTERFGAGYGEENDFSLRAYQRGWRNVCAGDVYVRHLGAVSFGASREVQVAANLDKVEALYPYYHHFVADFLRTDPLHGIRNRVQKAAWRQAGRIVLFVTLSLEGGAVRHADDMMARLTAEGCLALALCMGRDSDGQPIPVIRRWQQDESLRYPRPARVAEALADVLDLAPLFIHVQHLIDLPAEVGAFIRDAGIPYAVTLHDFFYGCPRVTLLDSGDQYCGMPPAAKCTECIRLGGPHSELHPTLIRVAETGPRWRTAWNGLLREAQQVIAPSRDTAERYSAMFPGLTCDVRPHFGEAEVLPPLPEPHPDWLLVAVPGAIGPQKGARQLVDLARHCGRWDEDMRFVVVGRTDRDKALERHANVELSGGYKPGEAVAALRASGCRVALFLSIFPETYSYTLSESLAAGLVPVAYDFGAIGERMRELGVGVLVPLLAPPAEVAAAIRRAASLSAAVPQTALYGQYGSLLRDYYGPALIDLAESMPPADTARLLCWPEGVERDRWCAASIRLFLWSPTPAARLALSFWTPEGVAMQFVEIAAQGATLARSSLDEGQVKRVTCLLPEARGGFLDVTCRFDFTFPLQPPDLRACAAMFAGIEIDQGHGWRGVDLPGGAF